MEIHTSEEWDKVHQDWKVHWRDRPNDRDLTEWLDEFWEARGGRKSWYPEEED